MYMDEIEFLYRAGNSGYKVFFTPQARFIHTGAASSGNKRAPVKNIFRGLIYFYRKHRTPMELSVLKFMLTVKARISVSIGKILGKQDLVDIYEEGLALVDQ
jgi:GT2 family glycosyltransferase